MAEGFLRHFAQRAELGAEVFSAGTEKSFVKPDAISVMREVGVDLGRHRSKTLAELPDPWNFDLVLTVCDSANEACPAYPVGTARLHLSVPDPSGESLERWRSVRDTLAEMSRSLVGSLAAGETPTEEGIRPRSLE
jgi:arsenate reductase